MFWSKNYDNFYHHTISSSNISNYIESLKIWLPVPDIEIFELAINEILGPQKDDSAENVKKFIKAYEHGILYNDWDWETLPLANILLNPSRLSKIIVKYGKHYLRISSPNEYWAKLINLAEFNNKDICAPAKLLAHHFVNRPYNQELLDESILYFKSCPIEEKEGAFSILYNVLNPFELT